MEILFLMVLYFFIGSLVSDATTDNDDIMSIVVFIAWPAIVVLFVVFFGLLWTQRLVDYIQEWWGGNENL